MAWDLGDAIPLTTQVTDADGELTNATDVVCTITQPDGTTLTPAPTNASTGIYTVDFVPTQVGRHMERWTSSAPVAARTDTFDVRPAVPAYIISLQDAKEHLNKTSTEDDEEIRGWLEAVTEIVESLAGKVIARRTVVEELDARCRSSRLSLTSYPVLSLTSVASLDGAVTWDVNRLHVDGPTGIVSVLSGPAFYGCLRVTTVAGYANVPSRLSGGAKMILRHIWETQRASLGAKAGQRNRYGMAESDMAIVSGYAIPRAAADMIGARPPLIA